MSHDGTFTEIEVSPSGDDRPIEPSVQGAWAWATEHGAPERASTEQLVSWLGRGELPPHTLVWRPGWGEWLPAMQVAELAHAFPSVTPGSRRVARAAPEGSVTPPSVPVAHYPRLRLLAKDVVGESAAAPFTSGSQGLAPARVARRALRDLDHMQKEVVTSQVPAAAMLEAARAMKRLGPPATGSVGRWDGLDLGTFGEAPPQGSIPPHRTLSPLAVELGFPALLEPESLESRRRPSRRFGPWLALGVLVGGGLGLLAVRGPSPEVAPPAVTGATRAAVAPYPSQPRVVTGPCRRSLDAVRLDEWAVRDVPLKLASLSVGARVAEASSGAGVSVAAGWVAVGYAQTHETAAGLALSPASLELARLVTPRAPRRLFSVSPVARDAELAFHVEREGSSFAYAGTVAVELALRVGMSSQGVVAGPLEGQPKLVWELPRGSVISVPALAAQTDALTIATLVGRRHGPLRVGVMSARGEPLSELGQIGDSNARFGRPALASGGGTTALAVAARSRDGSRQSLWLARADAGQPPLVLQPFEPLPDEPIGGGGADLDAPAIAALPGGGFALLFTQGHGSKRRLRLQRLSSTLAPLDAPLDVTTPDQSFRGASVGALHWVNDRLLAFHFVGRDAGSSLWVSSIECELGRRAQQRL
jgi:hypothetical protein